MIEAVIEGSIRHRLLVIGAFVLIVLWGVHAVVTTPVDAIPDLSENQVIVFADWTGRSPREIEDQVTYPLSVNMQGLAGVRSVRASSEFNFSMVSVIFDDGVDFYFARQRVLERLALAATFLPPGVVPYLAPDATALGQVFWYTVEGDGVDAGRLRAIQDWTVRYQLNSVPGVAQVASVGGFPIEYQVDVDPRRLRHYGVTLGELVWAVARTNATVGGRVVHKGGAEYVVRGVGWIRSAGDIARTVIRADAATGAAVLVSHVATVGLGTQFKRGVLEKDGHEVTGGVVLMRHGENPLEVTRRVKRRIEDISPGLPDGVRIVPFYDRTRLIEGAIRTLAHVLLHEIVIASLAILLILGHAPSAFVIALTLPLSVLVSFIMMRHLGIHSNIMSLSGIAISIGILVDQAIVMVENSTHHLVRHFGDRPVAGDTRPIVVRACRTVGRPIFFSVMIILVSFAPVFALGGREGKTFHPLAYTKSFAMIGVALISITLVPALIPTFLRGRLRREEESWIVRSMIEVYRPVLTWALERRNLVIWIFAAQLVVGAGIFPLDTLVGTPWKPTFLVILGLVTALTVALVDGLHRKVLAFASLVALGLFAADLPRIGKEYMPPLDEGTILDMPITVPRASVARVADDLGARDALLASFPEVEGVVGKAGRADTPTDPAPLDMVETVVNLRPREHWPRRKVRIGDARLQVEAALALASGQGLVRPPATGGARAALLDSATMTALSRFDATMRTEALARYRAAQDRLARDIPRWAVRTLVRHWADNRRLVRPVGDAEADEVADRVAGNRGRLLACAPAQEHVNALAGEAARALARRGAVRMSPDLLEWRPGPWALIAVEVGALLGLERPTLLTRLLANLVERRRERWDDEVRSIDDALQPVAVVALDEQALEAIEQHAGAPPGLPRGPGRRRAASRAILDGPLADRLMLWRATRSDLLAELHSVVKVPGWGNIWTQPIINRIDMLATGVRTEIGVKVFGPNLETIQRVCDEVARVLREIPGAADVFPDQVVGKPTIEVTVDRERAARYGISVGDVHEVIEVALGGKAASVSVEGRERHPIRIRYGRGFREDEEHIRDLLVTGTGPAMDPGRGGPGSRTMREAISDRSRVRHVPLGLVAQVRVVEGPSMIRSEDGMLRSYVQLNVRDRDLVGFVEEAQRTVAARVVLPPGVRLEWGGQFEHKLRSDRTMRLVFPLVVLLIFVILLMTYGDVADALLMMMAVPEALVGGALFLWLMGFNYSVAVQVGFIACFGMATETGIIMLVYLREAIDRRGGLEQIGSLEELREAIIEGAVHRLRPKILTEGVAIVALAPMLWASGVGHEVLSAMAAPVLGGLLIADEVVDVFIPVRFYWVRRARWLAIHEPPDPGRGEA